MDSVKTKNLRRIRCHWFRLRGRSRRRKCRYALDLLWWTLKG